MKHIASCSSGKDSVAMIEMLIDHNYPLDEIVFAEVEKEFKQEAEFRKFLINRYEDKGIKCVVLKTRYTWDDWFYGKITRGEKEGLKRGMPLTAYPCWWSREAKFKVLDDYMKNCIRYIGIAFDEPKRFHPEKYEEGYRYPLVTDFKMTEYQCLGLCKEKGVLNPLYAYFKRLGCYLCPKQKTESLITLCKEFPSEWQELKQYVKSTMSDEFVKQGTFNIKVDYQGLLDIEEQIVNHGQLKGQLDIEYYKED